MNGHKYDGAGLSKKQKDLRRFFSDLLALCQDSSVKGSGYWGLRYFNRRSNFDDCPEDLYSFARFEPFSSRVLIVVANFKGTEEVRGNIRLPSDLSASAHLNQDVLVKCVLDEHGKNDKSVQRSSRDSLSINGFQVAIGPQTSQVFVIE